MFTGFFWLGIGSSAGFCKHTNEPLGFIKDENVLTSWATISFWSMELICNVVVMVI
jgi:hypothetical protein